ncbi:MAG: hypothetical protein V3U92_08670 [Cellulophaga sp.]
MKKIILIAVILCCVGVVKAQRIVEETATVAKNQGVFVNFKFAGEIKVKQWRQNEIKVTATVNIDDGEGNEFFSLKMQELGNELKMYSDFGKYFQNKNKNRSQNGDCNYTTEINYVVYVPENVSLKVKSISGSVAIESFTGKLTTNLISGDVIIKKYTGELFLKTISGDLDVTITKAIVNAKTLTGTVYSNLEIKMKENKKHVAGHIKIKGIVNNGDKYVKMETISGNVYMRKKS